VWGKPTKEGCLLRLLRKFYSKNTSKNSHRNFWAELSSPQALYGPAISTLLVLVVRPSIQPVGCKYGQKSALFLVETYNQVWPILEEVARPPFAPLVYCKIGLSKNRC
jgi:hypothetical protein